MLHLQVKCSVLFNNTVRQKILVYDICHTTPERHDSRHRALCEICCFLDKQCLMRVIKKHMPFYRHTSEKVIYSLTDDPAIRATTHKGKPSGWTISGTLEILHADNPLDKRTNQLTKPTIQAARSNFEAKDSREDALAEYFRRWQPENTVSITDDEYLALHKIYSSTQPNH